MEDLFAARRVIEPGAVRMLAEAPRRRSSPRCGPSSRSRRGLLDEPDAFASAATRFHELLVERTGNNTLTIISDLVRRSSTATITRRSPGPPASSGSTAARHTATTATWSTSSSRARPSRPRRSGGPRRGGWRARPAPPRADDDHRPPVLTPRTRQTPALRRGSQLGSVTPSPASSKRTRHRHALVQIGASGQVADVAHTGSVVELDQHDRCTASGTPGAPGARRRSTSAGGAVPATVCQRPSQLPHVRQYARGRCRNAPHEAHARTTSSPRRAASKKPPVSRSSSTGSKPIMTPSAGSAALPGGSGVLVTRQVSAPSTCDVDSPRICLTPSTMWFMPWM